MNEGESATDIEWSQFKTLPHTNYTHNKIRTTCPSLWNLKMVEITNC